jgi:hypothetical protein
VKIETYLEAVMRAARTCLDTLRRPTAFRRPQSPTLRRDSALGPATRSHKLTPIANPVDQVLLFWDM